MSQPKGDEVDLGTEMCHDCGAMYHVVIRRRPVREHDWYNCAVCGRLLMEWDSSNAPCFQLVGIKPTYPPRKPR